MMIFLKEKTIKEIKELLIDMKNSPFYPLIKHLPLLISPHNRCAMGSSLPHPTSCSSSSPQQPTHVHIRVAELPFVSGNINGDP